MNVRYLLFAAPALLLFACAAPVDQANSLTEEEALFSDPVVTSDSVHALALEQMELANFNGAIAVYRDGAPIFEHFYGVQDANGADTLTRDSQFRLASVSKNFTAAGVLLLCQQGRLGLDDELNNYLPGFAYPGVTARQLLNHTSGVPDVYMDIAEAQAEAYGPLLTINEVVGMFCDRPHPQTLPPLTEYSYSNSGYVLLAGLIEQASGMSFEDFMRTELFEPLGMQHTRVWNLVSADSTFQNKTTGFEWIGGNRIPIDPMWIDGIAGDGGVFTSTSDLGKWEEFWRAGTLVSEELRSQAFAKQTLLDGEVNSYGFGWDLGDGVEFHTGGWLGASTYILRIREDNTMAVIYSNAGHDAMQVLVETLDKALGVEE